MIDLTPVVRPKTAEPWKRKSGKTVWSAILASTIPVAVALLAFVFLKVQFEIALIAIFLPLQLIAGAVAGRMAAGKRGQADAWLSIFTIFFGSAVMVLLVSVVWSVIESGAKAISWQFFSQNNVYISPTTSLEYGGVGHAIIGTLVIVALTTIITVPLGIASAVYLTETRGRTRGLVRTLVQAMSGLPSVVAGLFVYSIFIVTGITQYVGWAGSLALVPLMLPTVTRVAEEALLLVPQDLRNGALGLGASAWKAFSLVTMPAAKTGLITALLLGIARVIGETAPLIITTFPGNSTNFNVFNGPISTLPTYLYQFTSASYDTSIQRAWGAALVILMLVAVLFTIARILGKSKRAVAKKPKRGKQA